MSVMEINEKEIKEKINKNGKVIIDCYAPWCGPCRMISPIIDEIAEELKEYDFYKVNVDEATEFSRENEIFSIPTILVFNNGVLVERVVGFRPKEELKEIFSK